MYTRFQIINFLIQKNNYQSYLEIGTQKSEAAKNVEIPFKVGVDPQPLERVEGDFTEFHQLYSDTFFQRNTKKFDIIFIDGDHSYEQSKRDLINALQCLNKGGVIVMHDCLPPNEEFTQPWWCGGVFKTVNDFINAGFEYAIINTDYGCGIIFYSEKNNILNLQAQNSNQVSYSDYEFYKIKRNIVDPEKFFYGKELPQGWFSEEDIATYRSLINKLPDYSTIVELGSWKGRSICSVSDIIKKKNLRVYCVDTFKGTENQDHIYKIDMKSFDLYSEYKENLNRFDLNGNVKTLKCYTTEAVSQFAEKSIDLVFVDADHSEEAVKTDIKNFLPLLKDNAILAGHDYSWDSVREGMKIYNILDNKDLQVTSKDFWYINKNKIELENNNDSSVTAVICTKDRYEHLYNTILCVINQTKKPDALIIYDDSSSKRNLLEDYKWNCLFEILEKSGITWRFILTESVGQNFNHNQSLKDAETKYIWRVDDDLIFSNDILEKLYKVMISNPNVGAVGPRIKMKDFNLPFSEVSGKIADIFTKLNVQLTSENSGLYEVEHLHCSFLYKRKTGVTYHENLSQVGHREETIFSYRLFKAGYKLLVDLDTEMYHLKASHGGIRNPEVTKEMFESDENKFLEELNVKKISESFKENKTKSPEKIIFLDNGIGDHFAFKNILPEILNSIDFTLDIYCTFPEVFFDIKEKANLLSIAEGLKHLNENNSSPTNYSIYNFMDMKQNKKEVLQENFLIESFKDLYFPIFNIGKKENVKSEYKIFDCFPFFNELELLQIRMEELKDTVDKFIIVEASQTHSGNMKPFYLKEYINSLSPENKKIFDEKVILHSINFPMHLEKAWDREQYQRDYCKDILLNIANDEDYIIISDVDEIPRVSAIKEHINNNTDKIGILLQDRFMYYLNYKNFSTPEPQLNSRIVKFNTLKNSLDGKASICAIRYSHLSLIPNYVINNGGWHFTFMGGTQRVKEKLISFAHEEYNRPEITDEKILGAFVDNGIDFYTKTSDWDYVEINETFPKFIHENKDTLYSCGWARKAENKIKYSIIIPTKGKCEQLLKPCIESIIKYTNLADVEVIVVSNGSEDNTDEYVKSLGDKFKLLSYPNALGYPKATNEGIKIAKGEYLILLNNDCIFLEQDKNQWLNVLEKPFLSLENVGITGSFKKEIPEIKRSFLLFFCAMIPKKIIEEIGLLDESFEEGYCEDMDYCLKTENKGYKIVQVPEDKIADNFEGNLYVSHFPLYHAARQTYNDIPNADEFYIKNFKKIIEKYDNNITLFKSIA